MISDIIRVAQCLSIAKKSQMTDICALFASRLLWALSEEGRELGKCSVPRTTRTKYSVEMTVHVNEKLLYVLRTVSKF